jgi:hypothetical protein
VKLEEVMVLTPIAANVGDVKREEKVEMVVKNDWRRWTFMFLRWGERRW